MAEADFLVKLRDACQLIADAANEYLERKIPPGVKKYDTEKITWVEKTGLKGPYQYADPKTEGSKADFKALLKDLKANDGKFRHCGMFYWVFRDDAGLGRKQV